MLVGVHPSPTGCLLEASQHRAGVRDRTPFCSDRPLGAGALERLAASVDDAFRQRMREDLIAALYDDTAEEMADILTAAEHPAVMAVFVRERPPDDDDSAEAAAWRRLLAPWEAAGLP